MVGRPLCSKQTATRRGFGGAEYAERRRVLGETIAAFEREGDRFRALAQRNLERWLQTATPPRRPIEVLPGDWGEVTRALTSAHGVCFAVLNMANAFCPGGAYVEGAIAQEENLFRRTDCHFYIADDEYDRDQDCYRPHMTALLSAHDGAVYLDTERPRVCIRGPEDRARPDLGYAWLADDQVFPFYELRAAANDLRDGSAFDPDDARRRIAAQLDTLVRHDVRHAVLSAFGCGAFRNPADRVAPIYREELAQRVGDFDLVVFAIFAPGYGPDNFTPFAKVLAGE